MKSAYHLTIQGRVAAQPTEDVATWKHIWSVEIHNRHKFLLWRVSQNLLPTSEKLSRFMDIRNPNCLLCSHQLETLPHILLSCPVSKLIWWNSPWQLRIEAFQHLTTNQWITLILTDHQIFELNELD